MAANPVVPLQATPSVTDVADGMARLDPTETALFVLIVLFFVMVTERGLAAWGMRQERQQMSSERQRMWDVSDKFAEAAKEYSEATDKVVVELQVLRALAARVESNSDGTA
jgi:hypothetical protein